MNSVAHFLETSETSVNVLLYLLYDVLSTCPSLYPPINISSDAFQSTLDHSEELSLNVDSRNSDSDLVLRPGMYVFSKIHSPREREAPPLCRCLPVISLLICAPFPLCLCHVAVSLHCSAVGLSLLSMH